MAEISNHKRAELSVVLTTDTRQTIRGVLRRLQNQTARALTEIIMVVPRGQADAFTESDARGFADFRIVEVEEICPLARARDAGVRASTAPLVFLGETHAYPHPDWAQALIAVTIVVNGSDRAGLPQRQSAARAAGPASSRIMGDGARACPLQNTTRPPCSIAPTAGPPCSKWAIASSPRSHTATNCRPSCASAATGFISHPMREIDHLMSRRALSFARSF